jgi:hypothetical protein
MIILQSIQLLILVNKQSNMSSELDNRKNNDVISTPSSMKITLNCAFDTMSQEEKELWGDTEDAIMPLIKEQLTQESIGNLFNTWDTEEYIFNTLDASYKVHREEILGKYKVIAKIKKETFEFEIFLLADMTKVRFTPEGLFQKVSDVLFEDDYGTRLSAIGKELENYAVHLTEDNRQFLDIRDVTLAAATNQLAVLDISDAKLTRVYNIITSDIENCYVKCDKLEGSYEEYCTCAVGMGTYKEFPDSKMNEDYMKYHLMGHSLDFRNNFKYILCKAAKT